VVEVPWCSIIVPTLSDSPPAIKFLPPLEELERLGIELIVSKDMGWRNASRTRNMGAMKARGDVLCFIDDDVSLDFEHLFEVAQVIHRDEGLFVWHDPPHLLIIKTEDFFSAGGYDERFRPTMGETVELKLRLRRKGLKEFQFAPEMVCLRHLKEHPNPRYLLNQKHLTWAYLEYRYLPEWRLVWRKNPLEFARRVKWVLEWLLIRRRQKRSIITTEGSTLRQIRRHYE
jgi:glycosyltransferase involved in cell wall biosynthesis